MATSNLSLLLLAFSLLAISAAARPCKTLFFISSTTYYHFPQNPNNPSNPNLFLPNPIMIPRIRTVFINRPSIFFRRPGPVLFTRPDPIFFDEHVEEEKEESENRIMFRRPDPRSDPVQVEFYSSSIRDRTKDIMSVVGALLFGVGCGALTSVTMYLIWSLFWPSNRFDFDDDEDDDDDDDDDDDVSPKKMGYVAIPDDELKKPALVQSKEVV